MNATQQLERQAAETRERIQRELARNGTDVARNDRDPYGDGDQSELRRNRAKQQYHRELFAYGGDIHQCLAASTISEFAMLACLEMRNV